MHRQKVNILRPAQRGFRLSLDLPSKVIQELMIYRHISRTGARVGSAWTEGKRNLHSSRLSPLLSLLAWQEPKKGSSDS